MSFPDSTKRKLRFAEFSLADACEILLSEIAAPLHVNELYNFLRGDGLEFKGNNPTISIAVCLNRDRRFRKVAPGTFDLSRRADFGTAS